MNAVKLLVASILCISVPSISVADNAPPISFATLTVENDIIVGVDGGYTNGFAFSWAHAGFIEFNDSNLPNWLHAISKDIYISTDEGKRRGVSYMIAQGMQTSSDITISDITLDEAPYAGLLAWKGTLYSYDDKIADRLSLVVGIVGPASGAEFAQKGVHAITGSDEPKGWDNQLENELVFRVGAERHWNMYRYVNSGGFEFDFNANGQIGAGTLRSDLSGGVGFRIGNGLAASFATSSTLPGREINPLAGASGINWYTFLHVTGRYVFNDIFIDGNTFETSHSVPLKQEQLIGAIGFALNTGNWGWVVSGAKTSDQYEGQKDGTKFGSFSFTYRF